MFKVNKKIKIPRWLWVIIIIVTVLLITTLVLKSVGWFDRIAAHYVNRGDEAMSAGEYDEAMKQYAFALSLKTLDGKVAYEAYLKRGVIYLGKRNYDKATEEFLDAIKLRKKRPEAYLLLGDVYLSNHQSGQAVEILEKALKYDEENPELLTALGLAIFREGVETERSQDLWRRAIEKDPSLQDSYYYLSLFFLNDNLEKSQEFIDKAANQGGDLTAEVEIVKQSLESLSKKLSRNDINESFRSVLSGWVYVSVGEVESAYRLAQNALSLVSDYRDGWLLQAWTQIELGYFSEAQASLVNAYNIDPTYGQTQFLFARAEVGSRESDKAKQSFQKALDLGYKNELVHLEFARLLQSLGELDEAGTQYAAAYKLAPKDVSVVQEYLHYLDLVQKPKQAEKVGLEFSQKSESNLAKSVKAYSYYIAGKTPEARQICDQVIAKGYDNALVYYTRGLINSDKADFVKAINLDFEGRVGQWASERI